MLHSPPYFIPFCASHREPVSWQWYLSPCVWLYLDHVCVGPAQHRGLFVDWEFSSPALPSLRSVHRLLPTLFLMPPAPSWKGNLGRLTAPSPCFLLSPWPFPLVISDPASSASTSHLFSSFILGAPVFNYALKDMVIYI